MVVVAGTVVSVTVVSGIVVSEIPLAGIVESAVAGVDSGGVESTSTKEFVTVLEALGVLLTAQAPRTTKHVKNSALNGREKETLLLAIDKYYAKNCYF